MKGIVMVGHHCISHVRRVTLKVVDCLIEHGGNVNERDNKGMMPRDWIPFYHAEVDRYIQPYMSVFTASSYGQLRALDYITKRGKTFPNQKDREGKTGMHSAAMKGHLMW